MHAIEAHHNEVEPRTVEAVVTQAADAHQRRPPGRTARVAGGLRAAAAPARGDAAAKPGVDRVFAMQAGRDVRVMVKPGEVDDIAAQVLARDLAKQPGGGADLPRSDQGHRDPRVAGDRSGPVVGGRPARVPRRRTPWRWHACLALVLVVHAVRHAGESVLGATRRALCARPA